MASIGIIGVPLDLGADRRGVDMGPFAIRYAGLSEKLRELGHLVRDQGNIPTPLLEESKIEFSNAKFLAEVRKVCFELSKTVSKTMKSDSLPVVLGGDHSIAIGTIAGIYKGRKRKEGGVIWLDAHGDFNTPDITPSGNIHGMSLAISAGLGQKWFPSPEWPNRSLDPTKIAIVGARQLDPDEQKNLRKAGVRVFSMADIDRLGMQEVMNQAIRIASAGTDSFHVSFDMDIVDPSDAPGVGTPVRGGVTYREAHLAMEMISEAGLMESLEVVEVNPILDQHNETAELAVELILSALGKKII
ncbi:MAG: arginase [Nitrososphaerales archaeon]